MKISSIPALSSPNPATAINIAIITATLILLVAGFYLSPVQTGDDWSVFYGAAHRVLAGESPFSRLVTFAYFSNPPWVAVALVPFAAVPYRLGWAVLSALSMSALVLVAHRWKFGLFKTILSLVSPPMIYILIHCQIDMLILACLCLPSYLWPLAALAKPQAAFGMLFGVPRRHWLIAAGVTLAVIGVSFLVFGNWPLELIHQPKIMLAGRQNLWIGLWPFQIPAGVALILLGISRKDERILVAGSPCLSPYSTITSTVGPWLALNCALNNWQVLAVWTSWWAAIGYLMMTMR